jgi:hypothetical protein
MHKSASLWPWTGNTLARDAVTPMFMFTLHFMQPQRRTPLSQELIRSMITRYVVPEDQVEHVYVQTGHYESVDVVVFIATADLVSALLNGAALTSRLLRDPFRGWFILKIFVENAA